MDRSPCNADQNEWRGPLASDTPPAASSRHRAFSSSRRRRSSHHGVVFGPTLRSEAPPPVGRLPLSRPLLKTHRPHAGAVAEERYSAWTGAPFVSPMTVSAGVV